MKLIRFISMFIIYIIVVSVYYNQSYNFLINTTTKQIEQTLVNHTALRKIMTKHFIPELQRLKEENLLDKDYENPYLTSGTLLSEVLHQYTQPLLEKNGEQKTIYKIASLNPLNINNKATPYEEKIFNTLESSQDKKFTEIIHEEGSSYLFYAEVFPRMKPRCLQCHSTPEAAPASQVKQYGAISGYNYNVGDLPGIVTMRAPLDEPMITMKTEVTKIALVIFVIFLLLYILSEFVIYQLEKQRNKIAKNKKIRNRLIKESQKDPLTGLLNRRPLEEIFETERNRAQRDKKMLVFLFMDIDYFKKYNDTYGHIAGDVALKKVGETLSKCFNRAHEHVFRYGGEEFAVISSEYETKENAVKWVSNFHECLEDLEIEHTESVYKYLTTSVGICIIEPDDDVLDIYEVIEKADKALYEAKSDGRNQAKIYKE